MKLGLSVIILPDPILRETAEQRTRRLAADASFIERTRCVHEAAGAMPQIVPQR